MASEVYKTVNDLSPMNIQDLVNIKISDFYLNMTSYDFRSERKADIPRVKTTRYGWSEII